MEFVRMMFCCLLSILVFSSEVQSSLYQHGIGARIIGGEDAYIGQFPFMVAIYTETSDSRYFCGGALLNHEWILTAGHCVYNAELFTIQLGSNFLEGDDPDRLIASSSEYVIHPDFNPTTIENDVGLIKLRMSVTYNTYIQPINIPSVSLLNNTDVTVLGWGQRTDLEAGLSNTLRFVTGSVLSNEQCRLTYGNQITENMACIEGNYNEGTCNGDNGGPLVEYLHRHYWIVGIASFISSNGCESTDPSGFTRTFPYTEWIRSTGGL